MAAKQIEFRGKTFLIEALDTYPNHASWASYDDEINVKEAFWHPKPGNRVLDIGAAFGSYAMTALSEGANFVWAWSPQGHPGETEQEVLVRSAALNQTISGTWASRLCVYETGLWSRPGYLHAVTLEFRTELPSGITEFRARTAENWIKVDTLDDWWEPRGRLVGKIDLMKLDVEGAELEVLIGAFRFFSWHVALGRLPKILVEHHLFKKPDLLDTIPAYLSQFGYELSGTIRYSDSCTHGLYVPRGSR